MFGGRGEIKTRRAVAGGETIGGSFYKGGQFIPKDVLAAQAGLDKGSTERGIKRIEKAVEKGAYKNFFYAASSIRKTARESIISSNEPGPAREPIRTKRGRGGGLARRSILFSANKSGAVIGFSAEMVDQSMSLHEHGKRRGKVRFKKRPTMQLALMQNIRRIPRYWLHSID